MFCVLVAVAIQELLLVGITCAQGLNLHKTALSANYHPYFAEVIPAFSTGPARVSSLLSSEEVVSASEDTG